MKKVGEVGPRASIVFPDRIFFAEIRRQLAVGHMVTFRVRGNSMRPFLEGGRDKVVLAPPQKIRVGDVVLALTDSGNYFLHRVLLMEPDGACLLRGDGNRNGRERCVLGNIIGVASGFWRGNSFYSCQDWRWRFYSWLWIHLGPVRRVGLTFYNIGQRMYGWQDRKREY